MEALQPSLDEKRKEIRSKLIAAGVKQLQEFGYAYCNEELILTDMVYKSFFARLLRHSRNSGCPEVDEVIDQLLRE